MFSHQFFSYFDLLFPYASHTATSNNMDYFFLLLWKDRCKVEMKQFNFLPVGYHHLAFLSNHWANCFLLFSLVTDKIKDIFLGGWGRRLAFIASLSMLTLSPPNSILIDLGSFPDIPLLLYAVFPFLKLVLFVSLFNRELLMQQGGGCLIRYLPFFYLKYCFGALIISFFRVSRHSWTAFSAEFPSMKFFLLLWKQLSWNLDH